MNTTSINGEGLYYAFLSGAIEVRKQKNSLNKMNVFPVPDGDTGSNLIFTMDTIIQETSIDKSIKSTINSMADAALTGARGNSGIIFAQFINGINEEMPHVESISIKAFAEILDKAVDYAYKAILNPIEGTMLTVIREWVEAFYRLKDGVNTFEEIIIKTFEEAKKSLQNTPNLLKVLKKSSVVDSGASGFVSFLEGIVFFIKDKTIINKDRYIENVVLENEEHNLTEDISYRYCTEALISGNDLNGDDIKGSIKHLGDSLIVAGTNKKIRIHIHTNRPDEVFYILRDNGQIVQQKVDDMQMQYEVVNNRKSNVAILTDSIADLPQELIEKYQIYVIPMNLNIEGSTYLDKLTIKPDRFYSIIDNVSEYPTSSQPSQKSVERIFSFLTSHYDYIISIIVSKEMSGTFNIINKAAQDFIDKGKNIKIINSRLNSGAQGLLVLKAAKELEKGKTYEEVVDIIENSIDKTKIYVSVNTFKYMVKGGRVSPMKGFIANMLNLKPIVSIDEEGKGIAYGKAFSEKSNTNKILDILKKENNIKNYSIVHAHSKEKAYKYSKELIKILGKEPEYITEISPIVGLNAGIGAVAVAYTVE